MPADLGDLVARILLDSKEFQTAMKGVESQAQETADKASANMGGLSAGLDSIATAAASVAAAMGFADFLKDSLEAANRLGKLEAAFKALNGDTAETKALFEDLTALEFQSLYDFEDTLGPAAKNMLMLGVSAEQTAATMHAVVDAAAALKQGPEWITSVTDAIAKMQSHLVASSRDMKALQQEGVNAWTALAEEIGTSVPEAMAKVKAGVIDSQTVTEAVTKHLAELYGGAAAESLTSWKGALHILDETTEDAMVAVGNAIKTALTNAKPIIDGAAAAVKALGEWFGGLPAPVQEILILVPTMVTLLAAATAGFVALQAALGTLLFNPVILSITAVVAALALLAQWANENWPAIKAVFEEVQTFLGGIFNEIAQAWGVGIGIIQALIADLKQIFQPVLDVWTPTFDLIKGVFTSVGEAVDGLVAKFGGIVGIVHTVGELTLGSTLMNELGKLGGIWDDTQKKMTAAKEAADANKAAQTEARNADIEAGKEANKAAAEEVARANAAKQAAEEAKKSAAEFDRWFKAMDGGYTKIAKTEDDWRKLSLKAWANVEAQVNKSVPIIVTNLARWGEATPIGKFTASGEALEKLGITSTAVYTKAIKNAEDYAETVRIAFEGGQRSAADYNAALQKVADREKDLKEYTEKDVTNAYKTLGVTSTQSLKDTSDAAEAAYAKMEQSGTATATDLYNGWGAVVRAQQAVADNADTELTDAYHRLGMNSSAEMKKLATDADTAYQAIATSAGTNSIAAKEAWIKKTQEANAQIVQDGGTLTTDMKNELPKRQADLDHALEMQKGSWSTTYGEIKGILGGTFDDIISGLVEGDFSFAGKIKSMWQGIAKSALEEFFAPLKESITHFLAKEMAELLGDHGFGGLLSNIKDLGSGIGGIFSGGAKGAAGGAADAAAGGAADAAGGASDAAGGGLGSALGGFGGIFNMVTGAVSAISGVIGIFQGMHQESTLNAMEQETARLSRGLVELPNSMLNETHEIRAKVVAIWEFLWSPLLDYLFKFSTDLDSLVTNVRESMHTLGAMYVDVHDAMPVMASMAQTLQDARDALVEMPAAMRAGFDTLRVSVTATGVTTEAAAKIMGDQIAANLARQLVPSS